LADSLLRVSFIEPLNGQVLPELIADRHVLVEIIADDLGDRYATPRSGKVGQMSLVEIRYTCSTRCRTARRSRRHRGKSHSLFSNGDQIAIVTLACCSWH
jgi:CHASE2 domain-containing sensor protein